MNLAGVQRLAAGPSLEAAEQAAEATSYHIHRLVYAGNPLLVLIRVRAGHAVTGCRQGG
jgi:hypothetical protein